jgi:hypothetical protein
MSNTTGSRRRLRTATVAGTAAVALASPLMASAAHADDVNRSPAQSVHFTPAQNNPLWWGADCTKVDGPADTFTLDGGARTLVIKAGTTIDIWNDALSGVYGSASGKTISYVITCPAGFNT